MPLRGYQRGNTGARGRLSFVGWQHERLRAGFQEIPKFRGEVRRQIGRRRR